MTKTIAVLATLDTKGAEARWLKEQIEALGARALLLDMGVVGEPAGVTPDHSRADLATAGGSSLTALLANPTRQSASPVMIAGARKLLTGLLAQKKVDAVIGLGGTQGTSNCSQVMQALPYGFPKVLVSTCASGDTSSFVDIKDVTMMFSVGDLLGLNPLTRKILSNAAGAAVGMAGSPVSLETLRGERPAIGMTNLGTLTAGAMHALELFKEKGYEVIVFHAVGSGGRAMEQMMKEGILGAVFDYALGEITDELHHGLRAAGPERLTVAGELGLPQVICPGGAEHIGIFVEQANVVPDKWKTHASTFHNPLILAVRLKPDEMRALAREVAKRLEHTRGDATFLMPMGGTSRYGVAGGELRDPEGDRAFLDELKKHLPKSVELVVSELGVEDPAFVGEAVERLIARIEARTR
jgi:uncharacterized protein (UPF0261 family)